MRTELVRRNPGSQIVVSLSILLIGACSFLPLVLVATPANGQALVLMPGETYPNIAAAGKVVKSTLPVDPTPAGEPSAGLVGTAVAFGREDAYTQNIHVLASSSVASTAVYGAMVARGILFVDFCVPRPGAEACDSVSEPNAPNITISLTFQYGVSGRAQTRTPFADATLGLTGSVVDTEKGGFVAFQDLLGNALSSHGIQVVSIDWIPIPLPNHTEATITQPVTFPAILLKRGRIYRFQLSAAASADGAADLNAFSSFCDIFGCERKQVMLRNLTVAVSQDLTDDLLGQLKNLQDLVSALQEQIGNLVTRVDALETRLEDIASALNGAKPKPAKKDK